MAADVLTETSTTTDDLISKLRADWTKENPSLDTSGMEIVGRIIIAAQLLHTRLAARFKPFDLNYSDFDVLATLRRSGPPYSLTPTELMRSVILTSGAVTALLDRLDKRGLVVRQNDASDGRMRRAVLTKKGMELVDQVATLRFADAKEAIGELNANEFQSLADGLKTLTKSLQSKEEG